MKSKMMLSVGEVAARSGVAVSALHFYETKGLIVSQRTEGNQRSYERSTLRLVSLIKAAQNMGFSLKEIKSMLKSFPQDHSPTEADWQRLAKFWNQQLQQRIEMLQSLRDHLTRCIGCGCLSLKECPLRNAGDRLSKKGPGPHLIF